MNLPETPLERQIKTSPGRHFRTPLGRQIGTSMGHQTGTYPGRSKRIFRKRPGYVGGGRSRDQYLLAGKVAKIIILIETHYFIISETEESFQQIASNHSSDIEFKDFQNIYTILKTILKQYFYF